MAGNLVVLEGGLDKREQQDHECVVAELEKWVQRVRERKVVAIAIAAIAADESVLTQYAPSPPGDAFKLVGGVHHLLMRLEDGIER